MHKLPTDKFEVVIGLPYDEFVNGRRESNVNKMIDKWQEYAKEYYEKTDVYVSAIANEGKAVYNADWGCPLHGERVITFNCTANRAFIDTGSKLELYRKGIFYIIKKIKKDFDQHTITITQIPANVFYLTDENEDEDIEL